MGADLAKLGRYIADHCDHSQLEALCAELGLSDEQLLGDTHSARAFDLVTLAREQGQVSLLLAALARTAPDAPALRDFSPAQSERTKTRRRGGWVALGSGIVVLVVAFVLLKDRQTATRPSTPPTNAETPLVAAGVPSSTAKPSPTPTLVAVSPSATPAMPTVRPTETPLPATPQDTVTPSPVATATPTPPPSPATATASPAPSPSPTPVVPSAFPAWAYDPTRRTLTMPLGDGDTGRARLCTPFNAYHGPQAIYLIDSVADYLGVSLPAQARVTHSLEAQPEREPIVQALDVLRHPNTGYKVTGEYADFTGCDLVVSQAVRGLLGFPLELGEFGAAPRFEHGWVTIELLTEP